MPTQAPNESGFPQVVTATGVGTIGAGLPCNMVGIFVASVATSQTVNLWTQTATLTGQPVVTNATMAANTFYRVPAYFAKGITYNISNDSPNLTIFWCPAD